MSRFLSVLLFCVMLNGAAIAQQPDSSALPVQDSLLLQDTLPQGDTLLSVSWTDSVSKRPLTDTGWILRTGLAVNNPSLTREVLNHHPYFGFGMPVAPSQLAAQKKHSTGKERLFYLLLGLLIIYGFLKMLFPKYFSDLFRLFFRTTIKQRQIKEQLVQTPLPSLLLNGFFVVSTGLYLSFVIEHFNLNPTGNYWLLLLYCSGGLSAVYFIKFAGLKISGWLFGMEEAADSYIFIVFVVNKMLGILLLPFLVLIAFTVGEVYSTGLALSWCLVGGLLVYRFILTYAAVRNQVKVNPFHFLLYLCAFEIAPLLLIYKGLLLFFHITS